MNFCCKIFVAKVQFCKELGLEVFMGVDQMTGMERSKWRRFETGCLELNTRIFTSTCSST